MNDYFGLVKNYWAALAFGLLAVFWGNFGQTFFVGLFSVAIQTSLELSASQYGLIYSLATLASAATVVWAGGLIDHLPLRLYTTGVCLGLVFATALLSQAQNVVMLVLSFYCLRLFGQALFPHIGSTTMARGFDKHRGKALSIAASGVPLGEIILPALGVALIASIGWQTTYLAISGVLLLIVLPGMLLLIKQAGFEGIEASNSKQESLASSQARRALLADYRYWFALPGLMAGPFIVTGIFIHQEFVVTTKNWTLSWFATCFVVYGVVHWLSSLVSGVLVDRFSAVKLLPFYLLPMACALAALAFLEGKWLALLVMTLLASTIGGAPPITGSLWPEMYGVRNLGAIRSVNIAVMVFATALSPALYGYCIDANINSRWIFGLSALYVVIASALFQLSYFGNPKPHSIAGQR